MADNRPRPKYGELAPEGWVWQPPAQPESADVPVPSSAPDAPAAPPPYQGAPGWSAPPSSGPPAPYRGAPGSPAPSPGAPGRDGRTPAPTQPVRLGDTVATGLLLFFGILLSASMIPALFDFNSVLAQAAAMQGYGTYSPSAASQNVGVVAGVATIILNLGSIVLSVRRLQRHRLAFFVPLIFGAATFIVWTSAITFAYFNDPSFLQNLTTPTPTALP